MIGRLFYAAGLGIALVASAEPQVQGDRVELAKTAVARSLCYDVYWSGAWGTGAFYTKGTPVTVKVAVVENSFWAEVAPVGYVGARSLRISRVGTFVGRRAVVVGNSAASVTAALSQGDVPVYETSIAIPLDCSPTYEPKTPLKDRMLETAFATIRKNFDDFSRLGITRPGEIVVSVADFDWDYPETFVLVERDATVEGVFTLRFHDDGVFNVNDFIERGELPMGQRPENAETISRIRRHAIVRRIAVGPS